MPELDGTHILGRFVVGLSAAVLLLAYFVLPRSHEMGVVFLIAVSVLFLAGWSDR